VIINNLGHGHAVDGIPLESPVLLHWRWVDSGTKDEPVWAVQVDGEMTVSIARELVASSRKFTHIGEGACGFDLLESQSNLPCARFTPPPLQLAVAGQLTAEPLVDEKDFHGLSWGSRRRRPWSKA